MCYPTILFKVMLSLGWGKCETLATSHDTHPHCVTLKYIYPVPNRWTDFEPRVTWLMTTEHPLNMRRYLSHGPEPEDHCFPRLSWPQCCDFIFNAHHSNHFQFATISTNEIQSKCIACEVTFILSNIFCWVVTDLSQQTLTVLRIFAAQFSSVHCLYRWCPDADPQCTARSSLRCLSPLTDTRSPQHNSQHDQHMGRGRGNKG